MPTRNLHDHPFDEETILKLEIFEDYLKEWLPTFVMSHADDDICRIRPQWSCRKSNPHLAANKRTSG